MNEDKGIAVSIGLVLLGNILKFTSKDKSIGNFVQGVGIGSAVGTLSHKIIPHFESPHHDFTALASMPVIFYLYKSKIISDKTTIANLYGSSVGMLAQHLMTEGCSFCNTTYCQPGETLC